ncbi:hypothetical protein CHCC20488_4054 [Bacillus paralicheniformis]|nr:hypothetical protein SC10_B2orf05479 [Bacillus paralicheniformis]TWJ68984.1 hypothetical protein CHCC4186_2811 [Bacillus paralicheniformis]TWJ76524.1 hypothetical protein CHCC20497_0072 [Bacillus paralicheniformis]TWK26971.1 hypothetical protein CHCC20372_2015 [Bacillus paralicheniformis]TWK81238.1 hypothetical protein CHCC20331_3711 [Bacillus paralicheniformis]
MPIGTNLKTFFNRRMEDFVTILFNLKRCPVIVKNKKRGF